MINYLRILFSITIHRLWPKDLSSIEQGEYAFRHRITKFVPALRGSRPVKVIEKSILVQKTFTPPGWIKNAPDYIIDQWKRSILLRSFDYCKNPKSQSHEPHPKTSERLRIVA